MNLAHLVSTTAKKFSNRMAVIDGDNRLSFKDFNYFINRFANGFKKKLRLKKGDRAGLLLNNCHQYMVARLAFEKLGVVWVPLNNLLTKSDLSKILQDADVKALILEESYLGHVHGIITEKSLATVWIDRIPECIKSSGYLYNDIVAAGKPDEPKTQIKMKDICSINYTSGTSGQPKGAIMNQGNWINVYRNMLVDRDIKTNDILAHIGPLTHASGSYFIPYYLRGATNVIVPAKAADRIEALLETIEREKVTAFTCVPTVVTRILNHSSLNKYDLSSLKNIGYGAAPMPVDVIRQAVKAFGPIFTQNYGQTEAYMTICYLPKEEHILDGPDKITKRLASIGRPYTYVEVRVVDEQNRDIRTGEIGEIIVRSEHMMQGYWKLPDETAKTLKSGWLYTGDLATVDEDGYVFLLDRKKEMLISGGFNIYPREVEEVLYTHPAVLEAAVIGVPDHEWGEKVKAIVALKSGKNVTEKDLILYCKERISFKAPRIIEFIKELPKNAYGKIDKKSLRK